MTAGERTQLEKALVALRGLRDEMHKRLAPTAAPASGGVTLHGFALPALAALWLSSGESKLALAAFAVTDVAALWAFFGLGFHKPLPKRRPSVASTEPLEQRRSLLELNAEQIATSPFFGALESRFKGLAGTEYAESRPPQPGETGGRVDPVTTARMGETYYKIMEQERDAPLVIVADLSGSANVTGAGAVSRRRVIEDAAGALAFAAAAGGDKGIRRSIGLAIVTDRVETYIEPQAGEDQARRIFDALVRFTPRHTGSRLKAGVDQFLADKQPNSILVPISDFIGAGDLGASLAAAATEGHVIVPVIVEDPLDRRGFSGLGPMLVRDAETGKVRWAADNGAASSARERAELARAFEGARARPITLKTDGKHLDDLVRQAQELGS